MFTPQMVKEMFQATEKVEIFEFIKFKVQLYKL